MGSIGSGRIFRVLAMALLLTPALDAQAQRTIAYQGYLTTAGGVPLDATVQMTFSLYPAASGGDPLWSETQAVPVANGSFAVRLGAVTPLGAPVFDAARYLGVRVGNDPEMVPRQLVASAPHALSASCNPGDMVDCYEAEPATAGVGACASGRRRCGDAGAWGECIGQVLPAPELCGDGIDNDCDGQLDCSDGSCAGAPECAPEPECVIAADCGADTVSGCGACSFSSSCDESGTRQCTTCVSWACVAGSCVQDSGACALGCARETDGQVCGVGGCCQSGVCGSC